MALDLTALSDFNNETAGSVIPKIVYSGNTAEYTSVKSGIKYKEPLNLFSVDLEVQNGSGCVTTTSGSADFTQRDIQVVQRASHDGLCLRDMDTKYLGISALGAGSYNETFKFVGMYTDMISNQMKKANESFLWNATSGVEGVDGLETLISGSTAGVVVSGTADATLANLDTMISNIPSDVADRDDLTIFMSISKFRQFVANVRSANSYYFNPDSIQNRGGVLDMVYPYQNVRVVGTAGITGDRIVIAPAKDIVIGTDLESDVDTFQTWYSLDDDKLYHRLVMKLGVQIAHPEWYISNDL